MFISYLCTAMLGFLVFGLGLLVSLNRLKSSSVKDDLKNPSSRLSRTRIAHANACQYCPMLAVLLLLNQGPAVGVLGLVAVAARYIHAFGFLGFARVGPNPFLFTGAAGTYLSGLGLSLMLFWKYMPL